MVLEATTLPVIPSGSQAPAVLPVGDPKVRDAELEAPEIYRAKVEYVATVNGCKDRPLIVHSKAAFHKKKSRVFLDTTSNRLKRNSAPLQRLDRSSDLTDQAT